MFDSLPHEPRASGIVRTVVIRVTILALAALRIESDHWIPWIAVVLAAGVALLTQARARNLQQKIVVRAMRIMTVQAALGHWRVLPQERSTFFRMAPPASLVDGRGFQEIFRIAALRVMTVRARNLALPHGNM